MAAELGAPSSLRTAKRSGVGKYIMFGFLAIMLLVYLIPVYVMVMNGLKTADVVSFSRMWELPGKISSGGYGAAWDKLSPNVMSSVKLVIPATIISGFLGSLNGYILSKWKFRGSDLLFTLMLFGMFIPYQSILIPLIKFLQSIGVYGTIPGLILVHVVYGLPFTTLIFRNYFANVPVELVEAARVDGAGELTVFWRVVLPLARPGVATVVIFQSLSTWNEFLYANTVIQTPDALPLQPVLFSLAGQYSTDWPVLTAALTMAVVPVVVVYVRMQRQFVAGMTLGAVKS